MALPPSQSGQPAWSLVIPSCDNYNDTWPFLFHFLFKHWPDVPKPVYLIANTTTFADERVQTILVGPDNQWSGNVHLGLAQVRTDFLFMILDDFLLNATVDVAQIEEAWRQFHHLKAVYLGADNLRKTGEQIPGTWFCQVTPGQFYVGLNAVFFSKILPSKTHRRAGVEHLANREPIQGRGPTKLPGSLLLGTGHSLTNHIR